MYQGTIKQQQHNSAQMPRYYQILQAEEEEVNGIITEKLVLKSVDTKPDENISYRDFDIKNLQRMNATSQLQECCLDTPMSKIARNAEAANDVLEIVHEINQRKAKQQQTQTQENGN